jgi:hypothetical protein
MFRKALTAILLCLSLTACHKPQMVHENPDDWTSPQKAAVSALDELNLNIAAAASTLLTAYDEKTLTDEEIATAREALNRMRELRNEAEVFIGNGDFTSGDMKISLANAILKTVNKQLGKIRAKGTT